MAPGPPCRRPAAPSPGPATAPAAREILAKRIIDMAQNGLLDVTKLKDDALAHLERHPPAI